MARAFQTLKTRVRFLLRVRLLACAQSVVTQASVRAGNDLTTAEQVLAASRAGRLPRVLQHRLLLNGEVIEFEPPPPPPPPGAAQGSGALGGTPHASEDGMIT